MASQLTISGGATWFDRNSGDKKLKRHADKSKQTTKPSWWQAPWTVVQDTWRHSRQQLLRRTGSPKVETTPVAPQRTATVAQSDSTADTYSLRAATLALGVTTTGRIFYPPLEIAGLPLLIYLGIPPAQTAYTQLWVNGRPSRALAETVALTVCLASGSYWIGSLGCVLYYGGRYLLAQPQPSLIVPQAAEAPLSTTHIWQAGAVSSVATASLQVGDQVLLTSGDLVPVHGVIIEGSAWVRPQAVSATASGLHKGVGDRITTADIVLVGRICVRVLPTASLKTD